MKTANHGRSVSLLLAVTLGLIPLSFAAAQEQVTVVTVAQDSRDQRTAAQMAAAPIEEVIVRGQRSLGALLREGERLTEEFYGRFNSIIDNPDFHIDCRSEYPSGSNIPTRVCRTGYQDRLLNEQAVSIMRGLGTTDEDILVFNDQILDIQPRLVQMQREFEEVMLQAVNFDPVLNQQVIRLLALRSAVENYETSRERRRRERDEARAAEEDD